MPTSLFTPGDEKQDERLDPGQQEYDRRFNAITRAEEAGTFNDIANNYDKNADSSQEDENIDTASKKLNNDEASSAPNPEWVNNFDKNEQSNPRLQKAIGFAKKRGGIIGLIALFGVGGGILAGILGPASMLVNITENITNTNDSSSTALERRFMKAFGFSTKDSDPICASSTKSIKCKMGRISNKALAQLEKKGVKANFDNATNTDKKTGYPSKNPKSYTFDEKITGTGKPATVKAADLAGYLAHNPKLAAKVVGVGGAFNLRFRAWTGKYITQKLFKKFNLSRDGGLADGKESKGTSPKERLKALSEKLKTKIPGMEKVNSVADTVKTKVSGNLGKAKKGGVAYMLMVAGCVGVKAPGYIAAGVAAVQLAQIMPIIMDVVLSPGSKLKASGVDTAHSITSDDVNDIGNLLTEKTQEEGSNKMSSALDSPYLLAAMGVNKAKLPISKKFTPGYSILTNPAIKATHDADVATKDACNVIMSPASMYSAMAVDAAVTVAASATIVGGVVKVLASLAIGEIIQKVGEEVVGSLATGIIQDLAKNDDVPNAKGKQLGDVLGISAMSFFPAGGMSHNLPVLRNSQLGEYTAVQQENENFNRQMAIASLSPFDISSQYTFLGSIVHNIQNAALVQGTYGNITSMASGIAQLPFQQLIHLGDANAADTSSANACSYAADFGLDAGANSPAINVAGLPCTGITTDQADMSTEEAITLIEQEGWLDESVSVPDSATISDLLSSGYIKEGTPLSDFIETCSSPETGDYLYNAAGCTVDSSTKDRGSISDELAQNGNNCTTIDDEQKCLTDVKDDGSDSSDVSGVKNPRSLEAISVFLLDYQVTQSINGEDEDTSGGGASSTASAAIDMDNLYKDSTSVGCAPGTTEVGNDTGYNDKNPVPVKLCSIPNTSQAGQPAKVNSRVSGAVLAIINQMRTDLSLDTVKISDSFRTMASQEHAWRCYKGNRQAGEDCSDIAGRAAEPGTSNHQMGLAIDFQLPSGNSGSTRPGDKVWDWLSANASKFGYKSNVGESWHWSPTGG